MSNQIESLFTASSGEAGASSFILFLFLIFSWFYFWFYFFSVSSSDWGARKDLGLPIFQICARPKNRPLYFVSQKVIAHSAVPAFLQFCSSFAVAVGQVSGRSGRGGAGVGAGSMHRCCCGRHMSTRPPDQIRASISRAADEDPPRRT